MSTSQKIGLASVALICLILIGFYLGQDDPRSRRDLPAAAAIDTPSPSSVETPAASDNRPALMLPSASSDLPPTGLDAIVSRIKTETDPSANPSAGQASTLASNTPASIADGGVGAADRVVPLAEASALPASDAGAPLAETNAKPVNPLAAPEAGSGSTIASDAGKAAADPAITLAPSITAEKGAIEKITEVPSLTLGSTGEKAEVKPYTPVPTFDTKPTTPVVKDDPKQFADLAIIDDADGALARTEKPEAGVKTGEVDAGAANKPLIAASDATTDAKAGPVSDRPVTTTEAHPAFPVSSDIPTVVPKADANTPAVKPQTPGTATPKADTTPAVAGKPYTIKPGDTFSSIAAAVYGAEKHWIEIAEANPQVNPSKLKLGQVITLPELPTDLPKAETKSVATTEGNRTADSKSVEPIRPDSAKAADPAKTPDGKSQPVKAGVAKMHEVKAGENLAIISRKHFNTGEHWRHIYITNREVIGSDPGRLHVGMKLKITVPVKTVE